MAERPQVVQFDVQQVTDEANRFDIMARVEPFHDQLSLAKGRTLGELFRNVDIGVEAVFIRTFGEEARDIAVSVQRVRDVNIGGEQFRIVKRLLRAVAPDYQNSGFGSELTDEAINRLHPNAFTGRTPNPYVLRAEEKSAHTGIIFPLHELYTPKAQLLLAVSLEEKSLAEVNIRNGVCRRVYPKGASRLFILENASTRVLEIHKRVTDAEPEGLGADLEEGDGVRYLTIVESEGAGSSAFK